MDVLAILGVPIGALLYVWCVRPALIEIGASPRCFWTLALAAMLGVGASAMLGTLALWDQATGERAYSLVYWPLRAIGLSALGVLVLGWSLPDAMAGALGGQDPTIAGRAAVDELLAAWPAARGDAASRRRWLEDLAQVLAASGRGHLALDPQGTIRVALQSADEDPKSSAALSDAVAEVLRQFQPFDPVSWLRAWTAPLR